MRVYLLADNRPVTEHGTFALARSAARGPAGWCQSVADRNGCTLEDIIAQCEIVVMARERGLMAETV